MSTIRTEYRTFMDILYEQHENGILGPGLARSPVNPICARGSRTGTACLYTPELSMLKSNQFNQRTMCNQHLTEHFPFKGRGLLS